MRATLAVAATYVAFLLTAQFGFLDQVVAVCGTDTGAAREILAWMALAGLCASGVAAIAGRGLAAAIAVRRGLMATAIAVGLSPLAGTRPALRVAAVAIGAAMGWLTVSLAGGLVDLAPARMYGRIAGWGTGLAYLISNLPPLFDSSPTRRAAACALLCLVAAIWSPREPVPGSATEDELAERPSPWPAYRSAGTLVALFALVFSDSAFFATLRERPALFATTWGEPLLSLRQGAVHLISAVGAGFVLERGGASRLLVAVGALFGLAMPAIAEAGGASSSLGAIGYAAGIAAYSAALVAVPALAGGDRRRTLARAALFYGVAGWIGSTAGVGAAQDGALRAAARLAVTAYLVAAAIVVVGRFGRKSWLAPIAAAVAATVAAFALDAAETAPHRAVDSTDAAVTGRGVYLAEGCQYCHSQYVRPATHDEAWWGPARRLDRAERPPTPGNRRIGPDLANVGLRRGPTWNELHLRDPRALSPGSRMPSYSHLFADERGAALVRYLSSLGDSSRRERDAQIAAAHTPRQEGSPVRGRVLFAVHCAACHGAEGRGDGAAADRFRRPTMDLTGDDLPLLAGRGDPEARRAALARAVRFGLAPGLMPGHEWLSDGEVADLAAFVEALGAGRGGAS